MKQQNLDENEQHLQACDLASRLNAEYWTVSSLTGTEILFVKNFFNLLTVFNTKGENVNLFFNRLASVLFNESIKNELECENASKKQLQREPISNLAQKNNDSIKLSVKKNDDSPIFDYFIEKKCC